MRDLAQGNSVFESAFSWNLYVPGNWGATRAFLEQIRSKEDASDTMGKETTDQLHGYLEFKSRGLPRRLLQEFNALVRWDGAQPCIDCTDGGKLKFFSDLQSILQTLLDEQARTNPRQLPIDLDRWRLAIYYVTDRIVRTDGREFTVADIATDDGGFDSALRVSPRSIERLVEHLVNCRFLEEVSRGPARTIVEDVPQAQARRFRVSAYVMRELRDIVAADGRQRAELDAWQPNATMNPVGLPTGAATFEPRQWGDRYELVSLKGSGGMGTVYRGRDRILGTDVAIKVLHDDVADSSEARARFLRESQICRDLMHPNVVRTIDVLEFGGKSAIVMEFVDGEELAELSRRGPLEPSRAIGIMAKILDAVGYIHGRGIVRLDLKPSNILLKAVPLVPDIDGSRRDWPVLVDFGIARYFEESGSSAITMRKAILGTPLYMAPEQLRGEEVDTRTDIFAAGIILYQLLMGNVGLRGKLVEEQGMQAVFALMASGKEEFVLPPRFAPELRQLVATATALEREHRYPTAADMSAPIVRLLAAGEFLTASNDRSATPAIPGAVSVPPVNS
jgi:serine/threonine-protein kinase